jgi:hypothetical protein
MQRDAKETIIRLDYDGNYAEIWTENQAIIRRCAKFGYKQTGAQAKGVWLRLPLKAIHIKKWPPVARSTPRGRQFQRKADVAVQP